MRVSANDCLLIGRAAYKRADFYQAVNWMQETLQRLEAELKPSINESDMLEYFANVLNQQGNLERAIATTKRLAKLVPNHPKVPKKLAFYTKKLKDQGKKEVFDNTDLPPLKNERPPVKKMHQAYESLCRGEVNKVLKFRAFKITLNFWLPLIF